MSANRKIATALIVLIVTLFGTREILRASVSEDEITRHLRAIAEFRTQEIELGKARPGLVAVEASGTDITVTKTGEPHYAGGNVITPGTPFTIGSENINSLLAGACSHWFSGLGEAVRYRYVDAEGRSVAEVTIGKRPCLGYWLLPRDVGDLEDTAFVLALALALTFVLSLIAPRTSHIVRITAAVTLSWILLGSWTDWRYSWSWDPLAVASIIWGPGRLTWLLPALMALVIYLGLVTAFAWARSRAGARTP